MALDTKKLTSIDWAIVGGALIVFIALFLPWFGFHGGDAILPSVSGWSSGFTGWFGGLLLVAAGVYLFLLRSQANLPKVSVGPGVLVLGLAALGLLLVIIRWVTLPRSGIYQYGAKYGIYVALVAGIAEVVGAAMLFRSSGEALPWAGHGADGSSTPPSA
ncbi:MAG TPA: hypothetical protein VNG13_02920 [Mycobacteriales bacterium]|nr:hypothetical protein [Mycobacteriales bacterium]